MKENLRNKIISYIGKGLIIVALAVILATIQIKLFPNVDWSEVDTTPLYWPETPEPMPKPLEEDYTPVWMDKDSIMQNIDMECGE